MLKKWFPRLYNPPVFQGSLRRKDYFEGWYFKQVSADNREVMAFIPGIALAADPHAFVQAIEGVSGKTRYFRYDLKDFEAEKNEFSVRVGPNHFSLTGIDLELDDGQHQIAGSLRYQNPIPWPVKTLAPGIMGWYSFVPFMQCYHGVVSVDHLVQGQINDEGQVRDFNAGRGYIEKDWGSSFPECWIWLQSNTFSDPHTSLFLSVAKIPWLGSFFMGFLCFLYVDGVFYRFMTYTGAKIRELKLHENQLSIIIRGKQGVLEIQAEQEMTGTLLAPVLGKMDRHIKESVDARVKVRLIDSTGNLRFEGESHHAGLEIVGDILDYF